jgi:hypothetical protein
MRLIKGRHGLFYGCSRWKEGCSAKHGAHQDGDRAGQPLGLPGDAETREARQRAHQAFDQLWLDGLLMTRKAAYRWLRKVLRLKKSEAHIGMLTVEQCDALVHHAQVYLEQRRVR